jgi:acetylserotonin N-methyltransferase
LGRILHDWTEERIGLLLGRIHDALPSGGGLLIAETLLDDDGLGPVPALMQSLNMLVCTEGRERTAAGYRVLLERAGFGAVEARRTGGPLDAVLAIRKE